MAAADTASVRRLALACVFMGGAPARLQVRLAADPASVAGARRFVVDGLSAWNEGRFVDDAALVVSELATNAALHAGAKFMYVTLERGRSGVTLSVEDDGPLDADVVTARTRTRGRRCRRLE